MAEAIFYSAFFVLVYSFSGYPLLLFLWSRLSNRAVAKRDSEPTVAIIIPAHNEETLISQKLENCLGLDYPREKLTILVASDCSQDGTDDIVRRFSAEGVRLVALPRRQGKVAAQNEAVTQTQSEIIVFTDTAITTSPASLRLLVRNFSDPEVGAVSCRDDIVLNGEKINGESGYIKYDMLVRKYASRAGTLIGVTGGFYAVRRELAAPGWEPAFPPDFYAAIRCIRRGWRVVEEPEVRAYYKTTASSRDEFRRKVRTFNRGMHALFANIELLNPVKYGFAAVALLHLKLLRWLSPFFLLALLISGLFLWQSSVALAGVVGLLLSALGFLGFALKRQDQKSGLLAVPVYLVTTNLALLRAWYEFLTGKRYVTWQPTTRVP